MDEQYICLNLLINNRGSSEVEIRRKSGVTKVAMKKRLVECVVFLTRMQIMINEN